jgi:hypothetical protein
MTSFKFYTLVVLSLTIVASMLYVIAVNVMLVSAIITAMGAN